MGSTGRQNEGRNRDVYVNCRGDSVERECWLAGEPGIPVGERFVQGRHRGSSFEPSWAREYMAVYLRARFVLWRQFIKAVSTCAESDAVGTLCFSLVSDR